MNSHFTSNEEIFLNYFSDDDDDAGGVIENNWAADNVKAYQSFDVL